MRIQGRTRGGSLPLRDSWSRCGFPHLHSITDGERSLTVWTMLVCVHRIRLSEAHARMRFSARVEEEDVIEADRLIREALKESVSPLPSADFLDQRPDPQSALRPGHRSNDRSPRPRPPFLRYWSAATQTPRRSLPRDPRHPRPERSLEQGNEVHGAGQATRRTEQHPDRERRDRRGFEGHGG